MTTHTIHLQQEAASLADCLARGHHYASVHLARLIKRDGEGALHPFAAALGAQIRAYLQETGNPKIRENRLAQLDTMLHTLMLEAARDWAEPGYRETKAQPKTITCQAIRVNGQTCNAPVVEDSCFCRYHLNHESDR